MTDHPPVANLKRDRLVGYASLHPPCACVEGPREKKLLHLFVPQGVDDVLDFKGGQAIAVQSMADDFQP